MSLWKRDKTDLLLRNIERYERYAARIISPRRREKMLQAIDRAYEALTQNDIRQARTRLYEVEYHFLMARYQGRVLFYATPTAGLVSGLYLLMWAAVAVLALWYQPIREDSLIFPVIVAAVGGGIGGTTAVISNVVGIRLETEAITTRRAWYIAKPILGAIMGMVTYFALVSGLSLLSQSFQIENVIAVFLIGFLGGYLESFSTRVLNNLADKLAGEQRPKLAETEDHEETDD